MADGSAGAGWRVSLDEEDVGEVLVIDEDAGRASDHVRALERLGLRPTAVSSAAAGLDRLESETAIGTVIVDARTRTPDGRPFAADLRDRLGARRKLRTVVVADEDTLDLAFDNLEESPVELLCLPVTADDYRSVLGLERRRAGVRETSGQVTPRLAELSNEVGRIARALASLAESDRGQALADRALPRVEKPAPAEAPEPGKVTASYVRSIIKQRRAREQFFSAELFADPAWDILLDLTAARLEHKRVSVSSLCIAAAVPATTALRWIKSMTDAGLLVRRADPLDGRRVFIDLSDEAAAAMETYLATAMRGTVS